MAVINGLRINGTDYDLRDAVAVRFNEAQSMTDAQKAQARGNIGAVGTSTTVNGKPLSANVELGANDISYNHIDPATGQMVLSDASLALAELDINDLLLTDMIKGTRQIVVKTNGAVTGVNHVDINNNSHIVRADTFVVESDPMVETRVLNTGERLTISTDLTTLTSTITYTPVSA